MIFENFRNALRSIWSAKVRSMLTMLGIIIGVFAVLTMVSIGDGVKSQVTQQISDLGSNLLTIMSGQVLSSGNTSKNGAKPGAEKSGGGFNFAAAAGASTLTNQDVQSISRVSDIVQVAPLNVISSNVTAGSNSTSTAFVIATTPSYNAIRNLKFENGQFFSDTDNSQRRAVVVLGSVTKQDLFGSANAVGQSVLLRNQPFTVVGVLQASGSGASFGASQDDIVYLPLQTSTQFASSNQVYRIVAQVGSGSQGALEAAKARVTDALKQNHGGQTDFSVLTQSDLTSAFDSVLTMLTSFVIAIASISLLVGGIGIMNIMLVSVSERTREIGIRKAIGATAGNILWQFLIESIVITLLGGVIGLGLSFAGSAAVKKLANITPVFTGQAIALAFGVAFAVGVIFGIVPAIKAARKRPIQALKAI